jgi:hypothetical protein
MFGMFFEEEKLSCVFVESTPTKQITAAPLCRWVDHHLHLSPHIILISLVYFHLVDRLISQSINLQSVVVVVVVVVQNTSTSMDFIV